ncbi:hypothetical protein BJV74DRAFT_175421 [Russula compacta]|nr:hypothetical protein BJV74DRAFT_175421 [Russula compacta]
MRSDWWTTRMIWKSHTQHPSWSIRLRPRWCESRVHLRRTTATLAGRLRHLEMAMVTQLRGRISWAVPARDFSSRRLARSSSVVCKTPPPGLPHPEATDVPAALQEGGEECCDSAAASATTMYTTARELPPYDPHSFGHLCQAIASAAVHAISLPHLQLWQEACTQEPLQQPPVQQDQELASLDTQRKLSARWTDTGPTSYVADLSSSMDINSRFTGADAIGWNLGSGLRSGGGTMNGNGIATMPNISADFEAKQDWD